MSDRRVIWTRLLPSHRLAVIAKTPSLIALGVYASGAQFASLQVALTMLLASCLWTVLYAVNEATDLRSEQNVDVSKSIFVLLSALGVLIIVISGALSIRLVLLLSTMAIGQMIYCVPPMRLKRYWWAVLLLSGILNPVLRLECGALWGTHQIPHLAYVAFVSLHLGAAIRSRSLLRERDRKLGYRVAPKRAEWAGIFCTACGLIGAYALSIVGIFPAIFAFFTTIAAAFSIFAWSGRVTSVSRLRKSWLWFALLSLLALAYLLSSPVTKTRHRDSQQTPRFGAK